MYMLSHDLSALEGYLHNIFEGKGQEEIQRRKKIKAAKYEMNEREERSDR
jgi:hypothetical protein